MRIAAVDLSAPVRVTLLVVLVTLTGCLEHSKTRTASSTSTTTTAAPLSNVSPTISGTPATSAVTGTAYSFTPSASDPNGDALTFQIQNKPQWASFSTVTGALAGTPAATDIGSNANIIISVSDGKVTAALSAFTIVVGAPAAPTASVPLSWTAPTQNTDGSPLTDLAGFNVRYGKSADNLDHSVQLPGADSLQFEARGLDAGVWYFTVSSYNSAGVESAPSISVSTTV